mmetsp:Transcript_42815/g.108283  ORF Transcript_42815/g.108283 Transcript_42815/m.108283 type:complete len:237 (-) Transcript_42815:384-1094(-)
MRLAESGSAQPGRHGEAVPGPGGEPGRPCVPGRQRRLPGGADVHQDGAPLEVGWPRGQALAGQGARTGPLWRADRRGGVHPLQLQRHKGVHDRQHGGEPHTARPARVCVRHGHGHADLLRFQEGQVRARGAHLGWRGRSPAGVRDDGQRAQGRRHGHAPGGGECVQPSHTLCHAQRRHPAAGIPPPKAGPGPAGSAHPIPVLLAQAGLQARGGGGQRAAHGAQHDARLSGAGGRGR